MVLHCPIDFFGKPVACLDGMTTDGRHRITLVPEQEASSHNLLTSSLCDLPPILGHFFPLLL